MLEGLPKARHAKPAKQAAGAQAPAVTSAASHGAAQVGSQVLTIHQNAEDEYEATAEDGEAAAAAAAARRAFPPLAVPEGEASPQKFSNSPFRKPLASAQ